MKVYLHNLAQVWIPLLQNTKKENNPQDLESFKYPSYKWSLDIAEQSPSGEDSLCLCFELLQGEWREAIRLQQRFGGLQPPQAVCHTQTHSHTYFPWKDSSLQRLSDLGLWVLYSFQTLSQTCEALNPKTPSGETRSLWSRPSLPKPPSGVVNLVVLCENVAFTIKTHANPWPSLPLVLPQQDIWHLRQNGKSKNVRNLVTQHRVYYTRLTV